MKPHIYFQNGIWRLKDGDWRTLKGSMANHLAFEWCAKENSRILFPQVANIV